MLINNLQQQDIKLEHILNLVKDRKFGVISHARDIKLLQGNILDMKDEIFKIHDSFKDLKKGQNNITVNQN